MTVKELCLLTTYCEEVQFEDKTHLVLHPLAVFPSLFKAIYDEKGNYTDLANREVEYFDFALGRMRIKLKEN